MVEKRDGDSIKKKPFHGEIKTDASVQPGSLGINALKEGVVKRGPEIKFVVRGDGETYIAMARRIDIKSNGVSYNSVIDPSQIKNIVIAIYENREITF